MRPEPAAGTPAGPAGPTDPRPPHLRPGLVLLVLVGGALGTAAREALRLLLPTADGVPYGILAANLAGALLLGMLLEALARRGEDHGRRRAARLLLGTGVLGGFTTYSALATDTALLLGEGAVGPGLAYGLGTVVLGALATTAGIAIGVATHGPGRGAAR